MNILLIGSGGREHALAWKIAQSPLLNQLYIAPGNAGTASLGKNVQLNVSHHQEVAEFCHAHQINMVVVGPEAPLAESLGDFFASEETLKEVMFFGPQQQGAMLESSKNWAKSFMLRHGIPTAKYQSFTVETLEEGKRFLETLASPYVLKADGLAAGKGVLIINDLQEAKNALTDMLASSKFGKASETVVIEEFLSGIELSCFVITDGKDYKLLPSAKDYKRIGEGDTGLNTGGMGSVSPVPFMDENFKQKIISQVIEPTIKGLGEDQIPYVGFIFFGLIKVGDNPYVIEYNVRMGDPETESVIPRVTSDLLQHMKATCEGNLQQEKVEISSQHAASVMLVSGGYPESYEKGKNITGLDTLEDSIAFHAGTVKVENGEVKTSGGRVIAITALANSLKEALETSYKNCDKIHFEKKYCRKDIGKDVM